MVCIGAETSGSHGSDGRHISVCVSGRSTASVDVCVKCFQTSQTQATHRQRHTGHRGREGEEEGAGEGEEEGAGEGEEERGSEGEKETWVVLEHFGHSTPHSLHLAPP
eukprot:3662126-Rhodomonas_salina.2